MLIPMDDLVAIVDARQVRLARNVRQFLPRNPADENRYLHCPTCGGEFDAHPYGGGGNINVDSCERCGVVWLDGGELGRIVAAA